MKKPASLLTVLAVSAMLAACASSPPSSEMPVAATTAPAAPGPASAATTAADEKPTEPLKAHEASAQCWMKYDKANTTLEGKAKLVGKCVDDMMAGQKPK
jgi:hypothetical protein